MNTAELTALHTETLNEVRYARTLANIARRAETLWADGYTASAPTRAARFTVFTVLTPQAGAYLVCLSDTPAEPHFGDDCTCPAFEKYGECKHHLAVKALARDEAQAAEYDARRADADAFDPYAGTEFRNFCEAVN